MGYLLYAPFARSTRRAIRLLRFCLAFTISAGLSANRFEAYSSSSAFFYILGGILCRRLGLVKAVTHNSGALPLGLLCPPNDLAKPLLDVCIRRRDSHTKKSFAALAKSRAGHYTYPYILQEPLTYLDR